MAGPEAKVEKYLDTAVRRLGGITYKQAPTVSGVPDRLVVLPGARIYPVELKARRGRLRERQVVVHDQMAQRDYVVPVLNTIEQVDQWLAEVSLL